MHPGLGLWRILFSYEGTDSLKVEELLTNPVPEISNEIRCVDILTVRPQPRVCFAAVF
jgi:hypothetical protein